MIREPQEIFGVSPRECSLEQLEQNKRVADRGALIAHVDWMLRPPVWVYEDMEKAIAAANRGLSNSEIACGDGHKRTASELIELWELNDLLEVYARPAEHEDYRGCGYS